MKICHICLSCFYIDGWLYQENELVTQHVEDGHDVTVIASTETYAKDGTVSYTIPSSYKGADGAPVIRLPYRRSLPHWLARKIRTHSGVYNLLERLGPDVILFHGIAGWELLTVAKYVRDHPNCLFHIDSHTDANNSAKGWLSRNVLHRLFYRPILLHALKLAGPLLCVSTEGMDFAASVYSVPLNRLTFYPLGGRPPNDMEYFKFRTSGRIRLGLADNDVLLVQSGKQSKSKRLIETLEAFAQTSSNNVRLVIAGVLQDDIRSRAENLIQADSRVLFLGWQSPDALTELLCAADVYMQPGTQSATMQQSLCCRCAVILAEVPAHQFYKRDNGWFITDYKDICQAIGEVVNADLSEMSQNSYKFALDTLDYQKLAHQVLKRD